MHMIESLFFVLGICYILRGLAHVYTFIILFFCKNQVKRYGKSWALITGCTDGIGLGFAHELAGLGFNIVQVGRNPEKLRKCAEDLEKSYKVEVKSIIRDFSQCTHDPKVFFSKIFLEVSEIDISILVNNIGAAELGSFLTHESFLLQQNALNLFPMVFMTKLFLENLKTRKLRGGIINMSSLTAEFPTPFLSAYASGKSFNKIFSLILSKETAADVLCYEPGFVWTPLGSKFKFKFFAISHFKCAEIGVRALGNVGLCVGHWSHYLSLFGYWIIHLAFGFLVFPFRRFFRLK